MLQSFTIKVEEGLSVECTIDYSDKDNAVILKRHEPDISQMISLSAEEARCIMHFLMGRISKHLI